MGDDLDTCNLNFCFNNVFLYLCSVFVQAGDLGEALRSFERAGAWRQVFSLSVQLQYSPDDTTVLARRIASKCAIYAVFKIFICYTFTYI